MPPAWPHHSPGPGLGPGLLPKPQRQPPPHRERGEIKTTKTSTSKFVVLLSGAEQNEVVPGLAWCLLYIRPFSLYSPGLARAGRNVFSWHKSLVGCPPPTGLSFLQGVEAETLWLWPVKHSKAEKRGGCQLFPALPLTPFVWGNGCQRGTERRNPTAGV